MTNKTEIRIGGSGGQGVVLAAQILGRAAILNGKNALQTQAYGAEARGSLAKSEVIIADGKIDFPAVRECDILVAMSQEALDSLIKDLKETGILIVDSTTAPRIPETKAKVHRMLITETSRRALGETLYANMVMLGTLVKITNIVSASAAEKSIRQSVVSRTIDANIKAFRRGLELAAANA